MQETITQSVAGMAGGMNQRAVRGPLKAVGDRISSQAFSTAGLRISGGSASPLAQAATQFYASALGSLVKVSANTNMAVLFGTVANAAFNAYVFSVNKAGTVQTLIGQPSSTLGGIILPAPTEGYATFGILIINPTGTGAFVGGTTNLDDATVVPNAVFINIISPWDPSILPG